VLLRPCCWIQELSLAGRRRRTYRRRGKWGNSGEEKGIRERREIEKKNENTNTNNKT